MPVAATLQLARAGRRPAWRNDMRLPTPMMVMCVLMAAAAPAFGASQKDHDDCNAIGKDPDRNIAGCTRVAEDPTESEKVRAIAYVGRGLAWLSKGNLDRAMADLTDAIRLNPNDSLAYNDRALIWRDMGDVDHAIADFNEAIRLDPLPRSDVPGIPHVNVYTNRGLAWQAKGDVDRALADFDQALRQDGNDADAYFRRGQFFIVSKRDLDRAIADLGAAIRLDPNHAQAYYMRGAARYEQYTRASFWIERDDLAGAIADYSEVIRLDPQNARAYYARGLAWNTDGDRDRAVADFTEAVRLNPLNQEMVAALKQLKPDYEAASDAMKQFFDWPPKKK
jgi:tetratricopeptide (TPR) repeat protein